ncbi:MAG: NAD(+) diphosphatase [Rhodobacterales bacterium]|nr:NAD(+) diphosphatase [Rhodobacterales bacterium]
MKISETVTFGGSGLERMAELRSDPESLTRLCATEPAHCIVFWRGKPLVGGAGVDELVRLPLDHKVLQNAPELPVFLGKEDSGYCFAQDISGWQPADLDQEMLGRFFDQTVQHHPDLPADQGFVELRGVMAGLTARDAELVASAKALYHWHRSHRFCARCGAKSAITMAGWQRACDACGTPHFPRTDPVVIMLITRGNSVLMGRSPEWPEGMYSLLAGFVEPGETFEAAVRREVFEESGIHVGAVNYLASQPWAFPNSLMVGCHGVALDEEITIDPVEIEDAIWVTREEIMESFSGRHPTIKPARKGAIAHFILRNWLADRLE